RLFQVGEDALRTRGRYFSTVDLATLRPSFRSSPTIRGDPHVGFACHIARISSRTSLIMAGRPGVPCWLRRRQWSRNRLRCQAMTVRGWTNASLPYTFFVPVNFSVTVCVYAAAG